MHLSKCCIFVEHFSIFSLLLTNECKCSYSELNTRRMFAFDVALNGINPKTYSIESYLIVCYLNTVSFITHKIFSWSTFSFHGMFWSFFFFKTTIALGLFAFRNVERIERKLSVFFFLVTSLFCNIFYISRSYSKAMRTSHLFLLNEIV